MTDTPAPENADSRAICFEDIQGANAFEISVSKLIRKTAELSRTPFVDEDNIFRTKHGATWVHTARPTEVEAERHKISSEWTIPFKAIADNDLGLIQRCIGPVIEDMNRQFAENLYGMIGASAKKVGNVVDGSQSPSLAKSVIAMISKVEFGVDREGKVSIPQIHLHPSMLDKVKSAMASMSPEVKAELDGVMEAKGEEALAREAARKAKFKEALG